MVFNKREKKTDKKKHDLGIGDVNIEQYTRVGQNNRNTC